MKSLTFMDLTGIDFSITNISALKWTWIDGDIDDYTSRGRIKNLFFYMIKGKREYRINDKLILYLFDSDIIFIPNGFHYFSKVIMNNRNEKSSGICITFDVHDKDGNEIYISEPLKKVSSDSDGRHLELFTKIIEGVTQPAIGKVRAKTCLYTFFDEITSNQQKEYYLKTYFMDIFPAIKQIENHPEMNITISELAQLCCLSESSFRRKFKQYSNGVSPLAYRNHIRIMKAEELYINTNYTIENIAQLLGFCDAAHLCRIYKQYTGKTLKRIHQCQYLCS